MAKTDARDAPVAKLPEKSESWSVVDDANAQAWDSMTREEQLEALQDLLSQPEAKTATDKTVAQVLQETRARRPKSDGNI